MGFAANMSWTTLFGTRGKNAEELQLGRIDESLQALARRIERSPKDVGPGDLAELRSIEAALGASRIGASSRSRSTKKHDLMRSRTPEESQSEYRKDLALLRQEAKAYKSRKKNYKALEAKRKNLAVLYDQVVLQLSNFTPTPVGDSSLSGPLIEETNGADADANVQMEPEATANNESPVEAPAEVAADRAAAQADEAPAVLEDAPVGAEDPTAYVSGDPEGASSTEPLAGESLTFDAALDEPANSTDPPPSALHPDVEL
jgi:hypothetical protein